MSHLVQWVTVKTEALCIVRGSLLQLHIGGKCVAIAYWGDVLQATVMKKTFRWTGMGNNYSGTHYGNISTECNSVIPPVNVHPCNLLLQQQLLLAWHATEEPFHYKVDWYSQCSFLMPWNTLYLWKVNRCFLIYIYIQSALVEHCKESRASISCSYIVIILYS